MTSEELKAAGFTDKELEDYQTLSSAGFSDDEIITHLSAGVAPTTEEKPSFARRALNLGTKAILAAPKVLAEPAQIAYEGVAAPVNALARGLRQASQYIPDVRIGLMQGQSLDEAVRQSEPLRQRISESNVLPPTFGQGSWLGQYAGKGINALTQRAGIAPETAQAGGDILAMTGVPMVNRLASKAAPAVAKFARNPITSTKGFIPSAAERAGQRWVKARETLPPNTPQGASEIARIAQEGGDISGAMQTLGVEQLPYRTDPRYGVQQLAREFAHKSGKVFTSEAELEAIARKQAAKTVGEAIPSEVVDPARLNFVQKKLEAYNQTQKAAAESGKVAAKSSAAVSTAETALAELDKLEAAIPPLTKFDRTGFGSHLLNRLRGKTEGETATGVEAVRKVFNEEYKKFDSQPGAVAPSESLLDALENARESSVESGQILKNYVDEGGKIVNRLEKMVDIALPGEETVMKPVLPASLTLRQWRGLKDEFAKAAVDAAKNDKPRAAREFWNLVDAAKKGEMESVSALGEDSVTGYKALSKSYDDVMLRAYRRGLGGRMLAPGDTALKSKFTEEGITTSVLKSPSNARDLVAALGAEKAANLGKPLVGISEAEITALGRTEAQNLVRPLVESELAEVYKRKGGGKKGADAVQKYLSDKTDTLSTYGLEFDSLRKAATTYNETMARLTGAKTNVAKGIVANTLDTDPMKLGGYVLDSANPASAYKNLIGVSSDSAWKSSVDTLIKEDLLSRVEAGKDIFANVKTRAAMEQMYTPSQVKILEAYSTLFRKFRESPANFIGEEISGTPAHIAVGASQALPVGMGGVYFAKYISKFVAKLGLKASDDAVQNLLVEAHIEPSVARTIVDAYKGSRLAKKDLLKGVEKERKAIDVLRKMVPSRRTVPGAAATGVRKEAGQAPPEPEPEVEGSVPTTFGDEYQQVPRASSGIRG